jgi:hypothetical protein
VVPWVRLGARVSGLGRDTVDERAAAYPAGEEEGDERKEPDHEGTVSQSDLAGRVK